MCPWLAPKSSTSRGAVSATARPSLYCTGQPDVFPTTLESAHATTLVNSSQETLMRSYYVLGTVNSSTCPHPPGADNWVGERDTEQSFHKAPGAGIAKARWWPKLPWEKRKNLPWANDKLGSENVFVCGATEGHRKEWERWPHESDPVLPVGWNWTNSKSWQGRPALVTMAVPSPVLVWADVQLK